MHLVHPQRDGRRRHVEFTSDLIPTIAGRESAHDESITPRTVTCEIGPVDSEGHLIADRPASPPIGNERFWRPLKRATVKDPPADAGSAICGIESVCPAETGS